MQSAFSPEWRRRVPPRLGLRSPGKKSELREPLCSKESARKKRERERERERMTQGVQALRKPGLQLYFQRELLYPELHISISERYKVMQS